MNIDFEKVNGLVPAIIQEAESQKVLMLGYMNKEALKKTVKEGKVTFYSRTKNRLWTKGETSGNFLFVQSLKEDCDNDTLLIKVKPAGPVCHTGSTTCFEEEDAQGFLHQLDAIIAERKANPDENSYTTSLFKKGVNKIAQKVGEEAVELVIEAKDNNDELFLNEASDLMYHYLVLLREKGFSLTDIERVLRERHK
ncbi:bifunctional phosphoribosyl-AMP cyclohydrolase/phosphoribosyl-ATP diphosphatase HisIE [Xanthovirga aplysinae]|uniref:bifunctional phosphoribosyl-AMP cyclohydrolase/phosphoribosyl-ATP diphosphatase HisIE n=1 Tax=Xanthovirga aplysinae TaxID=2529853 RepID=UPI0012BCD496|nr:bifunctional phosphoribosyl-AMP cyclohydrolase/phosphoribosyl-ATP diphosphatase HisIE [Xanthovirga aplysinae]MTI32223.1 bifunctional phosphoribosyl-AMP cyclohydrolase/phosphoribosyl-ATP diphosphatase HisIE [Xanthovirga aplysinae]